MRSLKIDTIKVIRLTMTLGLALFISPVYAGVTDSSAAFAEKLAGNVGTDSVGSYAHPALGGSAVPNITSSGHPKAGAHVAPDSGIKREGSAGKKHRAPVMKKEGSGDKKPHAMKGGHGYSKKSEGSAGKKAYKKHRGKYYGKHYGKREGSKEKGYGYSRGHKGHGSKGHHKMDPFSHILKYAGKLGLSDQQIADFRKNRMAYMKITIRSEADHQIAHIEMESLVHSGVLDEARMFDLGAVILEAKKQKIHAMVTGKIAILKILTPEQRKKVSKMHLSHY